LILIDWIALASKAFATERHRIMYPLTRETDQGKGGRPMRELTFKERLFVEAYIGSAAGNATEAARKAGYAWPEKVGSRLVGRSGIKAAIGARVESAAISANEVLARVSDIATADITEFLEFDDKGGWTVNLVLVKRRRKGHLIRKVKSNEHGTEIELGP
jgi:hypothetical protein